MANYTITASSELMENYIQSDFLLAQNKFLALQTNAGASLLFSIGTGGVFYLTIEECGQRHGWRQVDLGSEQIKQDFNGHATVKTFGAAQTVAEPGADAQIHLAMVVNDGANDHLYLSLGNSDSDLGWTEKPVWIAAPFNAVDSVGKPLAPSSPLQIANVFLSEAKDKEYIVVDTIRNPGQAVGILARYYIDGSTLPSPSWQQHDLATDVQAEGYDSCLGRSVRAFGVDGLYTKGMIGSSAQLIYTPLFNVFDPKQPALPSRLYLPGGLAADAIATVRNADNTSDLYVTAQGSLYWFAAGNQKDQAKGVLIFSNPLLVAVRSLYACIENSTVTLWGLNGNDQVFYMNCPIDKQAHLGAWNVPLPIMTGVDAISPFIDRGYSVNTFFAHTGAGLVKLVKSPTTMMWTQRAITLPPGTRMKPATPIHSYTTHIHVTDANGQTAPNVEVTLSASNVTSVYINHLYHIIGPSPIQVTTDALGTVTIVETATTLVGTRFHISVAAQPSVEVNTMDTAWQRNAQYQTIDSLRSAKIVNRDGSTRNFIPAGTSADELKMVAESNQALAKAYASVASKPMRTTPKQPVVRAVAAPHPPALAAIGISSSILVDIGDLFCWLETGIDVIVKVIQDAAENVCYFIVTIGDAVFHAILDCVEAVVAAVTWIYNQIKIQVEDVIKFLEFVFGWQDILVTHKVLKNLFLCLGRHAVDSIETTKSKVADAFKQLQSQINTWSNIPDFTQSASDILMSNPLRTGQNSAPSNLGIHLFQGSCASSSSGLSPSGIAEDICNDLIKLVEAEGETLGNAADAIKKDIIDQFSSLSVTDVIKKLMAIMADTILQSAENFLVTLLDIFAKLLEGIIDILNAKLDIPILSGLYKDLTGDDLSFLDVVSLIAAIPVTVIYKAAANTAPFPQEASFTKQLISAKNMKEIQSLLMVSKPVSNYMSCASGAMRGALTEARPVLDEEKMKFLGLITGIVAFIGGEVLVIVNFIQRTFDASLGGGTAIFQKTLATIACIGNIAYVSPNFATFISIIDSATTVEYVQFNNLITIASMLTGLAAIPASTANNEGVEQCFLLVNTCISLMSNYPVIGNIVDNGDKWNTTYKSLIVESCGNFAGNLGGILEWPISKISDLKIKIPLILVQGGLMLTYGVCISVAGGVYKFASE